MAGPAAPGCLAAESVCVKPGWHRLVLLRHGETAWSKAGKHTGNTDLNLTDNGCEQARLAALTLEQLNLANPVVYCSPRRRALVTAELAGLSIDEITPVLAEWNYGDYEGQTTDDIRTTAPDWLLWTDGCPGGESVGEVRTRADAAISVARGKLEHHDVVFVGHGHFSRAVITRWVQQSLSEGARYGFAPATVAVCGFEHGLPQLTELGLAAHRETMPPT